MDEINKITIENLYETILKDKDFVTENKFNHPLMNNQSFRINKISDDFYELTYKDHLIKYSKDFIIRYEPKSKRNAPKRKAKSISVCSEPYVHNLLKEEAKKRGIKINCLINNILIDWIIGTKEEK